MANVDTKHQSYNIDLFSRINTIRNDEVIESGELDQLPAEEKKSYDARLKNSVFMNLSQKTIEAASAFVFKKPVSCKDGIKMDKDNVDAMGSTLSDFAKDVFESGLWFGHSFILVDAPKRPDGVRTLLDERELGIKPYFVLINRDEVINWKYRYVNGKVQVYRVVLKEIVNEDDGDFGTKQVEQYRVLEIGGGYLMRKDAGKETFYIVEGSEWGNSLSYIPLIPFYAKKTGVYESQPPFKSIYDLNWRLYNYDSWQWRNFAYAGNPILKIWGQTEDEKDGAQQVMAVNRAFRFSSKEDGDAGWLEFGGKNIEKLAEEIEKIKRDISTMGVSMLTSKHDKTTQTATERAIDAAQEEGSVASMAVSLEHALNAAYQVYLDMVSGGEASGEEIAVNREFITQLLESQDVQQLVALHINGVISKDKLIDELVRGDYLKEYDKDEDALKIDDEPVEA